jgi:uncharacterized protein
VDVEPSGAARLADAVRRPASLSEIAIVLGIPVALSLISAVQLGDRPDGVPAVNDVNALLSVALQVALAAVLMVYLRRRGWRPLEIAGPPGPRDLVRGLGLWLALIAGFYLSLTLLYAVDPNFVTTIRKPLSGHVSPGVVVAVAVIDPVFEEFLWLGYAIPAIANRAGVAAAFGISVFFRVAAHLYQGRLALIAILPVGLVLTWYFVRTGRLWPVIVAHVIQDAIALSVLQASG